MQSLPDDGRVEKFPGVKKVAKPTTVCGAERGKPVEVSSEGGRKIASKGVEREQSPTTPLRVEDDGKSEGRPVTGRIIVGHNTLCKKRVCDDIARKCAHFRRVNPGESACRRTWYKQTYNPPTMDGKHTDAAPALPKSLASALAAVGFCWFHACRSEEYLFKQAVCCGVLTGPPPMLKRGTPQLFTGLVVGALATGLGAEVVWPFSSFTKSSTHASGAGLRE